MLGGRCSYRQPGPAQLPVGPLSTSGRDLTRLPVPLWGSSPHLKFTPGPPGTQGCCHLRGSSDACALPPSPDAGEGLLACGLCAGWQEGPCRVCAVTPRAGGLQESGPDRHQADRVERRLNLRRAQAWDPRGLSVLELESPS